MNVLEYFTAFISKSPFKTPEMTVIETLNGEIVRTFEVPRGFQLEKYAKHKYPESASIVFGYVHPGTGTRPDFRVEIKDTEGNVFATFLGVYK